MSEVAGDIEDATEELPGRPNLVVEALAQGYAAYAQEHGVPWEVQQAVRMVLWCRTSALGGHVESCPSGDFHRVVYNSCGHRFCPRCAYRRQQAWLSHQSEKLLPVVHYHVIFTLPHVLNELWLANRRLLGNHLFRAATESLQTLVQDRLGVTVGITAVEQTWSQTLLLHPHLHCLVTGGGLSEDRRWQHASGFLVHVKPLMALFRGKYLSLLRASLCQGELRLPVSRSECLRLLHQAQAASWCVFIPRHVAPREQVLQYQGRYLYGSPIGSSRLLSVSESEVTFRYGGAYDMETQYRREETLHLSLSEFVGRLLLHVPVPGFQRVRHYGLYANSQGKQRAHCLELLLSSDTWVDGDTESDADESERREEPLLCPLCGQRLYVSRLLASSRTGRLVVRAPRRSLGEVCGVDSS